MATKVRGITIELGADTSGLSKALTGVNKEIGSTQRQLKDVERLLKLDPKNTELLEQKQRLLGNAVEQTESKLEALVKAQTEVGERLKETGEGQEQYDALTREIIACKEELINLKTQAIESNAALEKIGEVGGKIKTAGDNIAGVGEKLLPLSGAIAGIGVATSKMAIDFEDAMAKVSTIADESEVPMDEMKDAIIDLSNETGIAAGDIAENVYNAISAGQKTGDAVAFVGESAKLAKAGFADSGAALDILTTILNAYGLEAEKVTDVSNMLIQTQNLGKTTVGELSAAMGKVIPTAKSQGVQLDSLAASYAVMTSNGIATAETTTYLNSMLNELGKQGSKAADAFAAGTEHIKEGGLTMAEAMEQGWELSDVLSILDEEAYASGTTISNMFGSAEAGKAATVLLDNAEQLNSAVESMRDSAGATETAFNKLDTTSYKMEKTMNEVKNAGIELGESVLESIAPMMEKLAEKIEEVTQWFSSLDDEQKQTIIQIAALVAAIGPALIIIGKIAGSIGTLIETVPKVVSAVQTAISVFKSLWAVLMANPIILIIAAIVALVAAIYKYGDEIQAVLQKVDDFLQNIFAKDFTEVFGPVLGGAINRFMSMIKTQWDAFKKILDGVIDIIRGVFTGDWERAWNGVKEIFSGIFESLVGIAKAPLNGIITLINAMIDKVNTFISAFNSISFKNPFSGETIGIKIPSIPNIPMLAKGGTVFNGSAIVGEAGAELLNVNNGAATVTPLTNGGGGSDIAGLLKQYLPYLAEGNQIVLDNGVLVGAIAPQMNKEIGKISMREKTR